MFHQLISGPDDHSHGSVDVGLNAPSACVVGCFRQLAPYNTYGHAHIQPVLAFICQPVLVGLGTGIPLIPISATAVLIVVIPASRWTSLFTSPMLQLHQFHYVTSRMRNP